MKMNGERVQYNIKRVTDCLYFLKRILSNIMHCMCAHFSVSFALFPSALNESNNIFFNHSQKILGNS